MIRCNIIFVVFISCQCLASTLDNSNVISEDNAAYILLVQLQAEYCDPGHICSLTINATQLPIAMKHKRCCADCSCDPDCVRRGDCCLDYYLVDMLNGSTYSDVAEFISVLNNVSNADGLTFPYTLLAPHIGNNYTDKSTASDEVQCSPTSVFPYIKSNTIKMIGKCPQWFTNATVISQCNSSGDYNEVKSYRFLNFVPVTSVESGIVFRNIYCFRCNAKPNESASHWRVIYEVGHTNPHIEPFVANVEELFTILFSDEGIHNNIRFVPPDTEIVISTIEQCTTTETNDCVLEEVGTDISRTCRMFHAPVTYVTGLVQLKQPNGKFMRYSYVTSSNIACSRCSYFDGSQICSDIEPLQFMINNRQDTGVSWKQKSSSEINLQFSTNCEDGFIFDRKENLCRRVECPLYWENESGNCVPMFSKTYNGIFSMYILVEVRLGADSDEERKTFESLTVAVFEMMIKLLFGDGIPTYELSVWKYPHQDEHRGKYFVNFRVGSDGVPFVDALKLLSSFLQNTKAFLKLHEFETTLSITSEVAPQGNKNFRGFGLLRTDESLNMTWTNNVTIPRGIPVPLSRTHLCYRVFLDIADYYQRVSRHYFASKRTGVLVVATDLQFVNKDTVVDCIDNVMSVPDHILYGSLDIGNPRYPFGGENTKIKRRNVVMENQHDTDDQRGIWALTAFVVVVVIVVVSAKLRTKLQQSNVG